MGLNKTAFASIQAEAQRLANQKPSPLEEACRAQTFFGLLSQADQRFIEAAEERWRSLADHIESRRRWVMQNSFLPQLFRGRLWVKEAERCMQGLRNGYFAEFGELLNKREREGLVPVARRDAEAKFEDRYRLTYLQLQRHLAEIDEEERSRAWKGVLKLALAAGVLRYALPKLLTLLHVFKAR